MLTVDPMLLPATGVGPARLSVDLAIIVPTYNEAANIPILVEKLEAALIGRVWEVVFVDDNSPDGTAEVVRRIGRACPNVRCIQRIGRSGLSSAVIEGVLSVNAPYVAVMDADLQHDESLLAPMLQLLETHETDLVVGSRYMTGGSVGQWSQARHFVSRFATTVSQLVIKSRLTDPMSGFFMVRRECFTTAAAALAGNGYKILLDLIASCQTPLRITEMPYTFRARMHGESKLDCSVMIEHGMLLLTKAIGRYLPVRPLFMATVLVAAVVVHLGLLSGALRWLEFGLAQAMASIFGVFVSYLVSAPGRRRRLDSTAGFADLFSFLTTASIGLIGNLSLAGILYNQTRMWWLAGAAGAILSTLWMHMSTAAAKLSRR